MIQVRLDSRKIKNVIIRIQKYSLILFIKAFSTLQFLNQYAQNPLSPQFSIQLKNEVVLSLILLKQPKLYFAAIAHQKRQQNSLFLIILFNSLQFSALARLQHMPQTETIAQQYNRYKKTMISFPLKCKMYLYLLIGIQDEQCSNQVPKALKKNYERFTNVFKKLSPQERVQFIGKNINFVLAHLKLIDPDKVQEIHEIETTCEIKTSFVGVSFWQKRIFKFEFNNSVLRLITSKKTDVVELKNYLIRKSSSDKYTLVLEAIQSSVPENRQKISLKFQNQSIVEEIYSIIRRSVIEIANKRIELLLGEDMKENVENKYQDEVVIKGLTFLTQKIISQYFSGKMDILKNLKIKSTKTFTIHNKVGIVIKNSAQNSKYYFLDYFLPKDLRSMEEVKDTVNILNSKSIGNRYYSEKLESFTQNICAKYYKITTDSLQCESIMIVQNLQRKDKLQQIMKATQSVFIGINIPFINIEVKRGQDKRFILSCQAIIKSNIKYKNKSKEIIKLFLSMIHPTECLDTSNRDFSGLNQPSMSASIEYHRKKSFSDHSIKHPHNFENNPSIGENVSRAEKQDSSDENEEVFYSIQNMQTEGEKMQQALNSYSTKNVIIPTHDIGLPEKPFQSQEMSYLKAKQFLEPRQAEQKYIKQHFIFVDWKKHPKGGVICINESVIAEQKKIFKLICKQFGSKLFKMKSGISLSLPVQICKPESGLICIARNLSYAPLLFENHLNLTPLERIKNIIIFQVSMAALALTPYNPFNPVIGQTYQGMINGCPIYMEQLSHHPPISYIYLNGRGYKIYGGVSPQIFIRLNYVMGKNAKLLTIQFGNDDKVTFTLPTMMINGMLFGDRTIYYEGTNYIIDPKNMLIAEVIFNAGAKGFFGSNKEFPDFLTAHVYQVTPSFMDEFNSSKRTISPKKDEKNKLLTIITGEWNGILFSSEEVIFDFEKNLPLLLENYEHPLMSDSIYRTDALNLISGLMDKAQEEKQRLEQIQRRDKKLRENYLKQNKK